MKPRQNLGKLASLLLTAVLFVFLTVPALAVPYDFHYVWDGANVLSAQTEEHITRKSETLFQETGAQIAIVAVDFLDGEDIEDYTYSLFNTWGVGSTQRDNGFLLVMAIAEENYYLQAGAGVDDAFDGATLQALLDQYLEPDFAAEDYDAGALKLFDALYQEVSSTTGATPTSIPAALPAATITTMTMTTTTAPAFLSGWSASSGASWAM